jgi:hypothetical protein
MPAIAPKAGGEDFPPHESEPPIIRGCIVEAAGIISPFQRKAKTMSKDI